MKKQQPVSELVPLYRTVPSHAAMNGTPHTEISIMANEKYSQEIIEDSKKQYDLKKLRELKAKDREKFLEEAERQVNSLWHSVQALVTHTDLFLVTFQIAMGKILEEVESSFEKKSQYISWFKNRFGDKHIRYFEQARQLARMGDFAKDNASWGKTRLLQIDRLRLSLKKDLNEILGRYKFPDTSQDRDGVLTTEQVDGIITLERFKKAGINDIGIDGAKLLASYNHKPVEVGTINKLKSKLHRAKNKKEFLDQFIMNKMVLPGGGSKEVKKESLNKLLANLADYQRGVDINDESWLKAQRKTISREILINAYGFIRGLMKKLGIKSNSVSKPKGKEKHK